MRIAVVARSAAGAYDDGVRVMLASLGVAVAVAACAPPCKQIKARRLALHNIKADTKRPHAQVIIPFARLNGLLAQALRPLPSLELNPQLALVSAMVGITVETRSVRVIAARPGYVGVRVGLGFAGEASPLTSITVDVEVKPAIVRRGRRVQLAIGFGADTLRDVKPRFDPKLVSRLAAYLENRLPGGLGHRLPGPMRRLAAAKLLTFLSEQGFALIRSQLLDRIGQLSRTLIDLPELPITRVQASSVDYPQKALRLDVFTSLPVSRGLGQPSHSDAIKGSARLRVALPAVAQITNWAIESGRLPGRYGDDLKPKRDGAYTPRLQWRSGHKRPLVVHVFRESGECSYVRAGLKPLVKLENGRFVASYTDRQYEVVKGNLLIKLGLWLKRWLAWWSYKSKKVAAKASVSVGGKAVRGEVTRLRLRGNQVSADIALRIGR